ncbi:MAG: hypothetical protein QM657_18350 [Lacrimispora sp.]|uniref:hypothetical protein n=1 Tax=Lacrimispora sp. TaxID=2719234 RepID=UPI0039E43EB8
MKVIEIIEKGYLLEQQKLVDIFKQHAQGCMPELPVVFKLPRGPRYRQYINRIPCKTIGGKGEYHLISMQVVDFVRLMVSCGIEVKIYEESEDNEDD